MSTDADELLELLSSVASEESSVTEVIRPAAVLPEEASRAIIAALALDDVRAGGVWLAEPSLWRRYDRAWASPTDDGGAALLGSLQVIYGQPTRYEITVYRATVTAAGVAAGYTTSSLCDEAFAAGGLTLADCPRASLSPPPKPFRLG